MPNFEDLAKRCESASAFSRTLDDDIWEAVTGKLAYSVVQAYGHNETARRRIAGLPPSTSSVDSAISIVPENHIWSIDSEEVDGAGDTVRPSAVVFPYGEHPHISDRVFGATPALALCAAALKARARQGADSFLTKREKVIKEAPLDGHVIEPEQPWIHQAASIICGHDFINQRLLVAEQAEFEAFVREVLRTTAPSRSS